MQGTKIFLARIYNKLKSVHTSRKNSLKRDWINIQKNNFCWTPFSKAKSSEEQHKILKLKEKDENQPLVINTKVNLGLKLGNLNEKSPQVKTRCRTSHQKINSHFINPFQQNILKISHLNLKNTKLNCQKLNNISKKNQQQVIKFKVNL